MTRRGRPPHPDILTPREWEVLALLREGLPDQAIADRLDISLDGAKYHVREILSKLGVASRQEAAAWQPEAPAPARRWLVLPLALRIAGALVMVAAVGVLGLLAWGVERMGSGEAETGGDQPPEARAALMLAGRQLRGTITMAAVERTNPGAASDSLMREGFPAIDFGSADEAFWLVRLTGEFDVQDSGDGFRFLVPVDMPTDSRDSIERQCVRAVGLVSAQLNVYLVAGPEILAEECRAEGRASIEAAIAAAGQASYEVIGARALFDASAELTDEGGVWQVAISDLLFDAESLASQLDCRQLVVRLDASSLQIIDTNVLSGNACSDPPTYSMAREDVQSIAESKANAEIYLGTIEQIDVEQLRMADALTFQYASGYGGIHSFAENSLSAPLRSPAWRVAMRGAILLDTNPADLSHDIGACRNLTVYVDDATRQPIYMSYQVLDPSDCDLPIPAYPAVEQQ